MMNLIYGEVVGLNERDRMKMARIKIAGAIKKVSIGLLTGVRIETLLRLPAQLRKFQFRRRSVAQLKIS